MKHKSVKLRTIGRRSRHKQLMAVANHMMNGDNAVYLHSVYGYNNAEQWTICGCLRDIYLTWRKGHGFYLSRAIGGYDAIDVQLNMLFFPAARARDIQLVDRHDDISVYIDETVLVTAAQRVYNRIVELDKKQ